jgi:hypothetical protein
MRARRGGDPGLTASARLLSRQRTLAGLSSRSSAGKVMLGALVPAMRRSAKRARAPLRAPVGPCAFSAAAVREALPPALLGRDCNLEGL